MYEANYYYYVGSVMKFYFVMYFARRRLTYILYSL
jgi:hypothetical protein